MNSKTTPRLVLTAATICVGLIWCVLLPWLAEFQVVEERLKFLDDRGIDPSAMYYTELDAMDAILDRIEGRNSKLHCQRSGQLPITENSFSISTGE